MINMKATRVNPGALSPMEMNNMSSMMGMMNSIQKIGKGKRKYTIKLDKTDKKLLVRFISERDRGKASPCRRLPFEPGAGRSIGTEEKKDGSFW